MNLLWIEDFGGGLPTGTQTLESMFKGLLGFDEWDEDSLNLIKSPQDLEDFCQQQNSQHCIYLCRNYFDYLEFKANHAILNEIDAVITDINLDNRKHVSLDSPVPEAYTDNKTKFHENAGFFIFNDLIRLGIPEKRMCFMTGQDDSLDDFEKECTKLYMLPVEGFKKGADYEKLRDWIKERESDYIKLRRGIIKGCQYLKKLNQPPTAFNQFQESGKETNLDEIHDYLQILENFLPLREPDDKATCYKLFLRTLTHEWESAKPEKIKKLAWIMKSTRNWITHNSNLFNALDEEMLAYLFIINMRVMFDFDEKVESYEKMLLNLFVEDAVSEIDFKTKTTNKLIPFSKAYLELKNLVLDERRDKSQKINVQDGFYFNELANNIQQSNSSFKNDKPLFTRLLYQMFWLTTSNPYVDTGYKRNLLEIKFWDFKYPEKTYLFELARHIYSRSFP